MLLKSGEAEHETPHSKIPPDSHGIIPPDLQPKIPSFLSGTSRLDDSRQRPTADLPKRGFEEPIAQEVPESEAVSVPPSLAAWIRAQRGEIIADLSGELCECFVLRIRTEASGDVVAKIPGKFRYPVERELRARPYLEGLINERLAPREVFADSSQAVIVYDFVPGEAASKATAHLSAEKIPRIFRQAGYALARLHQAATRPSNGYEKAQVCRTLARIAEIEDSAFSTLRREHSELLSQAREELGAYQPRDLPLVPSHGDYRADNWIVGEGGELRVIDFGRSGFRPALADFMPLARSEWPKNSLLRDVFLEGYASGGAGHGTIGGIIAEGRGGWWRVSNICDVLGNLWFEVRGASARLQAEDSDKRTAERSSEATRQAHPHAQADLQLDAQAELQAGFTALARALGF